VGDLATREALDRRVRVATIAAAAAAAAMVGLWVAYTIRADGPVDFYVYYMAGALVRAGHSVYTISRPAWDALAGHLNVAHYTWPYRYPPYTAALTGFLTHLSPRAAMAVWVLGDAACLLAGAWLLGLALGGGWRVPLALAALVSFGPTYHTLYDGQVNGYAFFGLAVAFWGLASGRDWATGAGLAVATALKLTPLALIVYLAWRRRWRATLAALAVLGAITLVVLPLTGGTMFVQYAQRAYALTDAQNVNPSAANQTATGVVARLLLPSAKTIPAAQAPPSIRSIAQAFAAVLALVTTAVAWPRKASVGPPGDTGAAGRRPRAAGRQQDLLGFGMVIAATLVIGPFTWYHQFVWLLIPLLFIAERLIVAHRWKLLAALGILVLGVDANQLIWTVLRRFTISSGLYRGLSLPFVAVLVVWATTAALLVKVRRGAPEGGG
jgi:hypothetical protein